jgi:hypothetical protein
MMETEFVDNVLSRLIELPDYVQIESLRNAKILMDNWVEISESLTSRAIELEYYELCAILRDI